MAVILLPCKVDYMDDVQINVPRDAESQMRMACLLLLHLEKRNK